MAASSTASSLKVPPCCCMLAVTGSCPTGLQAHSTGGKSRLATCPGLVRSRTQKRAHDHLPGPHSVRCILKVARHHRLVQLHPPMPLCTARLVQRPTGGHQRSCHREPHMDTMRVRGNGSPPSACTVNTQSPTLTLRKARGTADFEQPDGQQVY